MNLWSTGLDTAAALQPGRPRRAHLQRLILANTAQVHPAVRAIPFQPGGEESSEAHQVLSAPSGNQAENQPGRKLSKNRNIDRPFYIKDRTF